MSNSKKNKKQKKSPEKKSIKINWIAIVIILSCFILGLGIGSGIKFAVKKAKAKCLDVAFYQLPQNLQTELEKRIKDSYSGKINIVDITDETFDARKVARQYDIVFSRAGFVTSKLERFAETLPSDWFLEMPTSLRLKAGKTLPIIVDHYELAYYRDGKNAANLDFPQTFPEFQDFLKTMKGYTFSPFFCAGSDDDTLLALISTLVEAFGGTDSYNQMIENFTRRPTLSQTIDMPLSSSKKNGDAFTLRSILDMIRGWQNNDMVHPNWCMARQGDVNAFIEDNQVGVLYTSLSTHREMSYDLVRKLDADRMPVFSFNVDHGLIAPYFVGMKFSQNKEFDKILSDLITVDVQRQLSIVTRLGPVCARSQAYDRQSDDVRFLVAACKDGPLPPLGDAIFQTNKDAKHNVAEEFRKYLRTGSIVTINQ